MFKFKQKLQKLKTEKHVSVFLVFSTRGIILQKDYVIVVYKMKSCSGYLCRYAFKEHIMIKHRKMDVHEPIFFIVKRTIFKLKN